MANVGKLVCSSRQLASYAETLGKKLICATTQGRVSSQKLHHIIRSCTPKGVQTPAFTTSKKVAQQVGLTNGCFKSAKDAKSLIDAVGGFFTYSQEMGKPLIFLNQRFKNSKDMPSFLSHEFRHFLDCAREGFKKLTPAQLKRKKPFMEKCQKIYNSLYTTVYRDLGIGGFSGIDGSIKDFSHKGLFKVLGCSKKDLTKYLRNLVKCQIKSKSPNENVKMLKELVKLFETERNAFAIQGKTSSITDKIPKGKIPKVQAVSLYMDELVKALKSELKLQQKYRIRQRMGIKIPNRKIKFVKNPIKHRILQDSRFVRLDAAMNDSIPKKVLRYNTGSRKIIIDETIKLVDVKA